jgi:hypothetical protein
MYAYNLTILLNEKCSNIIYNILNTKECIGKWKTQLSPYGVEDVSMKDVFRIDSSAPWLQYRILHRIFPTGYYLKKKQS